MENRLNLASILQGLIVWSESVLLLIVEDELKTSIVSSVDLQINGLRSCTRRFRDETVHQADVGEGACVEAEAIFFKLNDI